MATATASAQSSASGTGSGGKATQLPFTLGSAFTARDAFESTTALGVGTVNATGFPYHIPSFGWLSNLELEFSVTFTAGATTAFGPDGIDALIDNIGVRTPGGSPVIQPIDGFSLHMDNKFGGKRMGSSTPPAGTDPDSFPSTVLAITESAANTLTFTRYLQFELDASSALGCIPTTASNREFYIDLTYSALSKVFPTGTPAAASVTVNATAYYWDIPADNAMPYGVVNNVPTLRLLQTEFPTVNAGSSKSKSVNMGNIIMNHILIFRDSTGARSDADFSDPFEFNIDNNARFWRRKSSWKRDMANWFGLGKNGQALDAPGGLNAGVYVLPWRLLAGGTGADPFASHAQFLATQNTTQLIAQGYNNGAAGTLQLLTDAVSTPNAAVIYSPYGG